MTVPSVRERTARRERHAEKGRHAGQRDDAETAVSPNGPGCPRRRGEPVRDKALSLPALAATIGLLGAGAGLSVPALWRSASPPAAVGRPASVSPGPGGPRSPVPLLGTARLTSFTLPVAPVWRGYPATVAPLHGLLQSDMIVVGPSTLPAGTLAAIRRLPGVTAAEPVEAAKIQVNGKYTAVLGVDASTFRGYAARKTAASDQLWQSVADGAMTVSYTMGKLDKLPLGGTV